jgi:peptidase E/GNAT superfamily N-acetyltransferase
MTGSVFLGSSSIASVLATLGSGRTAVVVPTAANELPDRRAIVEPVEEAVDRTGAARVELDLATADPAEVAATLATADAVLVGGGDPYLLLDAARRSGFADAVRELLDRGGAYAGLSAGAMIAGPSLEPLRGVAPFPAPPEGTDLRAMGIAPLLVLAHTDREGRRALHEAALAAHGSEVRMIALADGEEVVVRADGSWTLVVRPGLEIRPAAAGDAAAIAEVFVEAGREGWKAFLTPDQLDQIRPEVGTWSERIGAAHPDDITVAVDERGVAGFIWVRQAVDLDLTEPLGEVATFYTHPRVWGNGVGRRLMLRGLDRLRAMGYTECVLWTEERNERPRRIYASSGWALDGGRRTRDFHGFPINELRHRLAL